MQLGLVDDSFRARILERLRTALEPVPEVLAAYLFGSAAEGKPVVNDVDLLVLLPTDCDGELWHTLGLLGDIEGPLTQSLAIEPDQLDLVPFDVKLARPQVLHRAVREGVLVKNADPERLASRIGALEAHLEESGAALRAYDRGTQSVLDEARLARYCEALGEHTDLLIEARTFTGEEFERDRLRMDAVRYEMIVAIDLIKRTLRHLLSRAFGVSMASLEEGLAAAAEHGVLSWTLARELTGASSAWGAPHFDHGETAPHGLHEAIEAIEAILQFRQVMEARLREELLTPAP